MSAATRGVVADDEVSAICARKQKQRAVDVWLEVAMGLQSQNAALRELPVGAVFTYRAVHSFGAGAGLTKTMMTVTVRQLRSVRKMSSWVLRARQGRQVFDSWWVGSKIAIAKHIHADSTLAHHKATRLPS